MPKQRKKPADTPVRKPSPKRWPRPGDFQNVAGPIAIDQLPPTAGLYGDDRQPFPLYGWLDVYWQETGVVVKHCR
jgi:hypothetical protein